MAEMPAVVTDAEVCPNTDEAWDPHPPHCWSYEYTRVPGEVLVVCRYCHGRKP